MRIVFIGPPASGKGTQSEMLAKKLKLPLISTGNLFRWHIENKTELGRKIEKIYNQGKLISNLIVNKIISQEIKKQKNGFILEGYPRNINQAKKLKSITNLDFVLEIWISDQEALRRLTGRRVCFYCGATYHLIYAPPKKKGICDKCGHRLSLREDDKREKVLKRLSIYHRQTEPLINFYQKEGILIKINGQQPILKVFKEIVNKLKIK